MVPGELASASHRTVRWAILDTPLLSICIPTYNRAEFLAQTLDSIFTDATEGVEVVIADNASEDETRQVIAQYSIVHPNIRYFRWDTNIGAEANFLRAVEVARGEYCWLMGSDDTIKPSAVARVLQEIRHGHDIYLCNATWCDRRLKPIRDQYWLDPKVTDQVYRFSEHEELAIYLNQARSLGALFAFISVLVFRRDRWSVALHPEAVRIKGYPHVYMLLSFLAGGCSLQYLREPLVMGRRYNDGWGKEGAVKRVALDIDSYRYLGEIFFRDDEGLRGRFLRVLRYEYSWSQMAGYRVRTSSSEWRQLENMLCSLGYGFAQRVFLCGLRYLRPIMAMLRWAKRIGEGIEAD
ncbi:MAG: glycosyltransferase family 2 protein [Symbiobacteriia bacterium]